MRSELSVLSLVVAVLLVSCAERPGVLEVCVSLPPADGMYGTVFVQASNAPFTSGPWSVYEEENRTFFTLGPTRTEQSFFVREADASALLQDDPVRIQLSFCGGGIRFEGCVREAEGRGEPPPQVRFEVTHPFCRGGGYEAARPTALALDVPAIPLPDALAEIVDQPLQGCSSCASCGCARHGDGGVGDGGVGDGGVGDADVVDADADFADGDLGLGDDLGSRPDGRTAGG